MNKKLIISALMAGITALSLPMSAMAQTSGTFVRGFVYNQANNNAPVANATVSVKCNNTTLPATTNANGQYNATFSVSDCNDGDPINVSANKDSLSGTGSGTVSNIVTNINIGVVNVFVSQVPEFGMLTGVAAFLTSGGALYAFRRRNIFAKA